LRTTTLTITIEARANDSESRIAPNSPGRIYWLKVYETIIALSPDIKFLNRRRTAPWNSALVIGDVTVCQHITSTAPAALSASTVSNVKSANRTTHPRTTGPAPAAQ
jgi:hypothetical protein